MNIPVRDVTAAQKLAVVDCDIHPVQRAKSDLAPFMPARYLISGGVSMRSLMPGWSFGLWRGIENALGGYNHKLAMFAHVVLRRT